ncbi:PREDICTED: LOW QUALITY PROTEIN: cytochrome c oxidase assembly factor 4 homolog, mitochondrial [Mesitornis unicolor]|uniref:LOW QUALITY PROTEIN: cytochrome c oxidase assembly factor 4 homolog, mitochondrial n=1 Tax=Mesitornis unicolor TaxID=54374 RepID=UPI0005283EFC|nr:PREDICTED: LOW QUALITY PROTEIN: cytochrome c oxidase assembly factor 4 homolog, mitochondrial [Mesitornis unicolor]
MARRGHARSHLSPEKDEDEEAEDPLDAMIARTGCMAQHRELQECMTASQVRAFGECMARQQRAKEPHQASSSHQAQSSPAGD